MTNSEIKRLAKKAIINNLESTLVLSLEEVEGNFGGEEFEQLEQEVLKQYNRVVDLLS